MGIGNHELIEFEETYFDELAEEFIKLHSSEWEDFRRVALNDDEPYRVNLFCHEWLSSDWADFVMNNYNNQTCEYTYDER